jgi:hypothetical protein
MRECPECKVGWPEDRFTAPFSQCFKCRIQNLGFSFENGGREGKQMFHDQTNLEYRTKLVAEAKANGIDAVPVGKPSFYGMPSAKAEAKVASAASSVGVGSV